MARKRPTPKKSAAKRAATKKKARKRPATKKSAAKRATTKKKAPKRPAPKKSAAKPSTTKKKAPKRPAKARAGRPSSLIDTRIIHCGDCLDQLAKLPDACVDLIYIDPPFNSNRNYEVFWGEGREKRAFEDRHASKSRLTGARSSGKMPGYGA